MKLMTRRLRGQLNKMSLDTFEKIYPELLNMVKCLEEVKTLIDLLFEKATTQHTYVKVNLYEILQHTRMTC